MKRTNKQNSGTQQAMMARYGKTTTTMRDRRKRRPKDARRSFQREEW